MTDGINKDDFDALLEMARDKTAAGRARLASATSDLFSQSNEVLTDHERALMSDILRRLLHDAEMSVRSELSNKLAPGLLTGAAVKAAGKAGKATGPKTKKGTGKRLTAKQRAKMKKEREKALRKKRRAGR